MKKAGFVVLSFALLAAFGTTQAEAKPQRGLAKPYYADLNMGLSFGGESDVDLQGQSASSKFSFKDSFLVDAAVGYDFGRFRLEGGLGYARPDVKKSRVSGVERSGDGDLEVLAFMFNGYYDFENSTSFTPFIGTGMGIAQLNMDARDPSLIQNTESDSVFAYQFTAGGAYDLSERFAFLASYRYFATTEGEFQTRVPSVGFSGKADQGYADHQLRFGLRYRFY